MSRPPRPVPAAEAALEAAPSRFVQARTPSRLRDFVALTKPEITFLVVLSALAGFALGTPGGVSAVRLAGLLVGVALTSAGGAVFNHVIEAGHDATMHRTVTRPIPSGRVSLRAATYYGAGLIAAGVGLLCPTTNWATAALALLTVGLYLGVYTPLKRVTTLNTLVGTIPGALPALGGYVAATGTFGAMGWAAFGLLACWQMPHFLSLAWMYRKDYARGGFAMSTVTDETGRATAWAVAGFTALTVAASLLPVAAGRLGWGYGAVALALGAWFAVPAVGFLRDRSNAQARRVLKASVLYIPLLVLALAVAAWT